MGKKVLIVNAIPTNNGDAALVFALREKLREKGYHVDISTKRYNITKKLYPEISWIKAIDDFSFLELCLKKIIRIEYILKAKLLLDKKHKGYDVIIAAPGGYINSYYGFYERLYIMKKLKEKYKSKLIMYSQSVGPLSEGDKKILYEDIDKFDLFMVRDEISYQNVTGYDNILKTNDAAFLLNRKVKKEIKKRNNVVGISVREWKHDCREKLRYYEMIKKITIKIIDEGYEVEFISTCQGIQEYVDDSIVAKEIYASMEEIYREKIKVVDRYFELDELRNYLENFEFVIGTRLHMCILSIISGIPAFNISYEVKGRECYKILELEEYSIDYNEKWEKANPKLDRFIKNQELLKEEFSEKYYAMNDLANEYFDYMIKKIIEVR